MGEEQSLGLATLDFLEAAYTTDGTDEAWLALVIETFERVWGRPQWIYGTIYDASDVNRFKVHLVKTRNLPEFAARAIKPIMEDYPSEIIRRVYRQQTLGFGSSLGMHGEQTKEFLRALGVADIFGLNTPTPDGIGCDICVGTQKARLDPAELLLFSRLAAHLTAAYRCRRRLREAGQTPLEGAEAILDVQARVLDASGPAVSKSAREAMTMAARAREEVRRRPPSMGFSADPSDRWRPRVRTRWTLVDAVDRQGERYIVARENQANTPLLEALTERERQVVASAATGRSNKEIAYDLGISHSTARVLLARACGRLGVQNREELLALPALRAMRGESTVVGPNNGPGD